MRGSEEQIGFLLFRLAITRTREPMEKRRRSNGSSKNHAKWMLFLCAKKPTNTTTCKRRLEAGTDVTCSHAFSIACCMGPDQQHRQGGSTQGSLAQDKQQRCQQNLQTRKLRVRQCCASLPPRWWE